MIETIVKTNTVPEKGFPKLMKSTVSSVIVLMSTPEKGTVISGVSNKGWGIGHYADNWIMRDFEDFNGTVELSNKRVD